MGQAEEEPECTRKAGHGKGPPLTSRSSRNSQQRFQESCCCLTLARVRLPGRGAAFSSSLNC